MKYYCGIGSRATPKKILAQMQEFAYQAAKKQWILRSGGAEGADTAFELGCDNAIGNKEIFLPWFKYNNNSSPLYPPTKEANRLVTDIRPRWAALKLPVQLLMARNAHQVLGQSLDVPVSFVVCWSPDGAETFEQYSIATGGTGIAIVVASINNIPVFNLHNKDRYIDAVEFLLGDTK